MCNKFLYKFKFSIVLLLTFGKFSFESNFDYTLEFGLSLRRERIDERVCEGEEIKDVDQDEEWDLCFKSKLVTTTFKPIFISNLPKQFQIKPKPKQIHCYCDHECHAYKECCSDILSKVNKSYNQIQLSCIDLYSGSHIYSSVYGINRCDDNWLESESIRDKCEFDSHVLKSMGKDFSYIQDIAVLSESSKMMYKNMFCAVCNNDSSSLMQLNMSVECGGHQINDMLRVQKNIISPQNYDPFSKNWKLLINNQTAECSVIVKEFQDLQFTNENKLRKCQKTISKCPLDWNDSRVAQKCESYASYVYEVEHGEKAFESYKNFHCALCNGADIGYLTCFYDNKNTSSAPTGRKLWFPLLLDFNFAGNKGQWIGGHIKCPNIGEIYDPIYEKCIFIHCGSHFSKDDKTGRCLPLIENSNLPKNGLEFNCSSLIILDERIDFVFLPNKSIYINKTQIILSQSDYEVYDEDYGVIKSSLKVKICKNESSLDNSSLTQSPFDASFGQILLSGICLYTSIVCLTLHLIVYAVLPKLRNLPGKNLVSLSSSLLIAHLSFVTASQLEADRRIGCVLIAITTHYSYLASFCWMSVMAFDVCRTFRRTSRRSNSSKRYTFLKYSLYAWLLPAVIVIICAAFDIGLKESNFQPLYGYRFCWISQRQALLVFFASPVAIIVGLNIFLFSLTARGFIRTAEQTKILNKNSDKVRYYLYIKLSVVMGLTWIFGFIASLTNLNILWYPFIILNGLQGALIFFAFTCKRKVWNLLMEKFGFKAGYIRTSKSGTTSDIIRPATGSTSLQTSTLIPSSPNSNVTKIQFPK